MASTHLSLHYHLVFSTKERRPLIHDEWRDELHRYLGGCIKAEGGIPEMVGGVEDHVHILAGLRATHCLADVVREIKKVTSRWVHEERDFRRFEWQEGYGAFTVSVSNVAAVKSYIENQPEHHRKFRFEDEYRELLKKHAVTFDERYLF